MAGPGAMLIGSVANIIIWFVAVVFRIILTAVIFVDAYRSGLKTVLWCVMAVLFGFYSLPFYIYVRIKTANLRCESCGEKVGQKKTCCSACGAQVKKFDDGAFAKKIIIYVLVGIAAFGVFGGLYVMLTDLIQV